MIRYGRYLLCLLAFLTAEKAKASSQEPTRISEGSEPIKIALDLVADKLSRPIGVYHAGDGSDRLFVVEQSGRIRVLKQGTLSKKYFLDIRNRVSAGGEKGLLGLAFHPNFRKNRRLFVNYTARDNGLRTVISEWTVDERLEKVDPKSERQILTIRQPFSNHNGGQIAFGPDGYLYIGTGDGGAGNDPEGNGQNLRTWLGKMLRIDIDRKEKGKAYAIPPDNPFTSQSKIAPEIWAYGLRNPWRFSFDRGMGHLYVGDVGQNRREEINIIRRGLNYGWNIMEGNICTPRVNRVCDKSRFEKPIFDYPRSEGTVVIGGYVYRGRAISALKGAYLYGDFGNGRIWMLKVKAGKVSDHHLLLETDRSISAFGEDAHGELYVVDYGGKILKIVNRN